MTENIAKNTRIIPKKIYFRLYLLHLVIVCFVWLAIFIKFRQDAARVNRDIIENDCYVLFLKTNQCVHLDARSMSRWDDVVSILAHTTKKEQWIARHAHLTADELLKEYSSQPKNMPMSLLEPLFWVGWLLVLLAIPWPIKFLVERGLMPLLWWIARRL